MSMVSTLAKVAAGALVARGVSGMMKGGASGGLGGMLGGMLGGQQGGAQGGGLGGMLGGMLGGQGGQQPNQQAGGMGGAAGAGGLGGMLGGMLAGQGQQGGGIGGLLESLGGGGRPPQGDLGSAPEPSNGSMGSVLNSAFKNFGEPEQAPTPDQEAQAQLFLRAMINAAKSDGQIDDEERQKILGQLGDVDPQEAAFVQSELAAPLDVDGFVRQVPQGMEEQVYLMSLMGIQLDNQAEAQYLDRLAKGMNLSPEVCNAIHDKLGAPKLYT